MTFGEKMATPGFTAEVGVASTGRRYRTSRHASRATADSLVTPAASGFHYIGVTVTTEIS
jgi:hypothetical protein